MNETALPPLRIASISTPRSGNTWTRKLVCHLYDLQEVAIGKVERLADWDQLPPRCGFVLHWPHTPELQARLERHGIHTLSLARHPFDVLISILHFALFEPGVAGWLPEYGAGEKDIVIVPPCGPEFHQYACGPKAVALLNISASWWQQRCGMNLRYEDLVSDPVSGLNAIIRHVGVEPSTGAIEQAIAATSMQKLRTTSHNNHFWKGEPNAWKRLLCPQMANAIAAANPHSFRELGYLNDPNPELTAEQANATWYASIQEEWWEYVRKAQIAFQELNQTRCELAGVKLELANVTTRKPLVQRVIRRLQRAFTQEAA